MFTYCKSNPINRKDEHGFMSSMFYEDCGNGMEKPLDYVDEGQLGYNVGGAYKSRATSGNVRTVKNGTKAHTGKIMQFGKDITDEFMTKGQFLARETLDVAKDSFKTAAIVSVIVSGISNYMEIGHLNKQFYDGWAVDALMGTVIGISSTALVAGAVVGYVASKILAEPIRNIKNRFY